MYLKLYQLSSIQDVFAWKSFICYYENSLDALYGDWQIWQAEDIEAIQHKQFWSGSYNIGCTIH